MQQSYLQHQDTVIRTNTVFSHVMAIALNPKADYREGVVRCITSRVGDVHIRGYIDRSELHVISGNSLEYFTIGERLRIKNEDKVITSLTPVGWDFIGLEDPDIFIDEKTGLLHLYFTLPIKPAETKDTMHIHLGHAVGPDLHSLVMTDPVLLDTWNNCAKELSIAPINRKGVRYNLIESRDRSGEMTYSIVQIAIAKDMGKSWEYGEVVFHPKEHAIPWIAGHASPGPLFPKSFLDIGEGKLVGIINGREANRKINEKIIYGMFSIGLFIYDYEEGKIDWVSPEPFIQDIEAKTITFASQFVQTQNSQGILYAHVDDSFVRAYTLDSKNVLSLLP